MIIEGHSVYLRPDFKPQKDWAVFFDRDGVINAETNFVFKLEDCVLIPAAVTAIKKLNQHRIPVLVVHNAAVVARNLCRPEQVETFNRHLIKELLKQGAVLDAIFYCPHHANAYNPQFKKDCDWRKPQPGMLLAAQKKFHLDLTKSYLLGDHDRDMEAGKKVAVTGFLIKNQADILSAIKQILL
ncbi:MAG: D,D-heptose 1,7-bisphosphate phosphatase [Candidatus Beckwithbacteria bacterium GW2011_GWA2_43_10]|uniref:D,D-heptose 1,7-bisphosphate phosphatase n=1 Tax=Candidatus Beckwithbacteria bacterium GW2011_GWA2_43_10 TaxID=1618369 RepID=A0A0G1EYE6_9BACT|nr:MAG: D,D-heptose 1,7-bisphosphate phosphatase [Candidatus Beckwithbacteria bacterium GW2011_GWA2_43_10]